MIDRRSPDQAVMIKPSGIGQSTRQHELPKYAEAEIIDEEPRPFDLLKELDGKQLSRLVRKYERATIAAAVKVLSPRPRGRPSAEIIDEAPPPSSLLQERDRKQLARLVGKYGRATIAAAVKEVPLRSRGRPSSYRSLRHAMDLAYWIEERAEQKRSGKPYVEAVIDLYELECQSEIESTGKVSQPDIHEFLKKTKKARLRGRGELKRRGLWGSK
jgi:hypothetical protein